MPHLILLIIIIHQPEMSSELIDYRYNILQIFNGEKQKMADSEKLPITNNDDAYQNAELGDSSTTATANNRMGK